MQFEVREQLASVISHPVLETLSAPQADIRQVLAKGNYWWILHGYYMQIYADIIYKNHYASSPSKVGIWGPIILPISHHLVHCHGAVSGGCLVCNRIHHAAMARNTRYKSAMPLCKNGIPHL